MLTISDVIQGVTEVMVRSGGSAPSPESLRLYNRNDGEFVLIESEGQTVGFCAFRLTAKALLIDAFAVVDVAWHEADGLLDHVLALRGRREAIALLNPGDSDAIEWFTERGFHWSSRIIRKGKLSMALTERRSEATLNRLQKYFGTR